MKGEAEGEKGAGGRQKVRVLAYGHQRKQRGDHKDEVVTGWTKPDFVVGCPPGNRWSVIGSSAWIALRRSRFIMSEHKASISWKRTGPAFLKGKYSREHTWTFDGGVTLPASS